MFQVGGGFLELIQSEPSAKAGYTGTSPGFVVSPDTDTPQAPGTACSSNIKKFYLMSRWNLLCFSSCPSLLILSPGSTESGVVPPKVAPAFETGICAFMDPFSVFSTLNFLTGLSAQARRVCLPDCSRAGGDSPGCVFPRPCPAAERARHLVGCARLAGRPQPAPRPGLQRRFPECI